MSSDALPPRDRDEEPDPPAPGESRSAWIKRWVRDYCGVDFDREDPVEARRKRLSQEERTDLILRGIDPDSPGIEG